MPAARAALERFYHWADGVQIPELSRLARTVRAWEAEILAFHTTKGCSNGPTEAVNLLIKKVKRVGHGFRNFANYRLRLLLHCGVTWQTSQTARLRGHSPRLVAHEPPRVPRATALAVPWGSSSGLAPPCSSEVAPPCVGPWPVLTAERDRLGGARLVRRLPSCARGWRAAGRTGCRSR
jgi:hypothetical protein